MKKSIKGKGLAVGLAASLVISSFLPGISLAAEKGVGERTYEQLERLGLKQDEVKASNVTKGEEQKYADNQLVIKYTTPLSASHHRKAGGKQVKRFSSLGYDVIEVQGKNTLEAVAKAYAKLPNVTSVSRSAYAKRLGTVDPKASSMYHLKNLNVAKAQSMAGKNKVKVGVIDTGVYANHPELKNQIVANKNAMDPMKKGLADTHGTHVAGIIGAEKNNGVGGYGIAPNSDIVSIDVFNRSMFVTDYVIAEGILEAIRQKVKVVNMSLGTYMPSPILQDAVQKAIDSGIVIVAAAGNDGDSIQNYPASFDGVISVGATDSSNKLAFFSTYGPSVDVVAPGHMVYAPVFDPDKGASFVEMSGTSMASPVVAGAVSLLLSKHPNLTPYQVNYILTKTAKDLGDKGYDLKYGYGMVDLEKMLSFDPKKIPADPSVKESEKLSKAKDLGDFEEKDLTGKITKLKQEDLYKTTVNKDEYVQISLEGAKKFDLKFELLFFKEGQTKPAKVKEINDAIEGATEGTLFKAPDNGTLVVAVKDSFGKYLEDGQYTYKLQLEKSEQLPEDTNTFDNPVVIDSLPHKSGLKYYFVDEKELDEEVEENGDSDFFQFTIPGSEEAGPQLVKIDLSGVPGIDSTIILHAIEEMDGEEFQYEMDMVSDRGFGQGESLTFTAYPGQKFVAEITNRSYFSDFFFLLGAEPVIDKERSFSSLKPYGISIDYKEATEDEDGLPFDMGYPEDYLFEDDFEGYQQKKAELRSKALSGEKAIDAFDTEDAVDDEVNEELQMIMDLAIPFEENETVTGSLQMSGDQDWFAFTPEESSIFELSMNNSSSYSPVGMEVYKYDPDAKDLTYLYTNMSMPFDGPVTYKDKFTVGLQEGETYYFVAVDPMYRPVFNPYRFTIKSKIKNVADAFEANDSFENATKITTKGITANYSLVGDTDIYYFKPGKEGIYGVSVTPGAIPAKYKNAPDAQKSEIDPVLAIVEDTNGNGKLDPDEEGRITLIDNTLYNEEERGSFRAKKNAGYFIVTYDYDGNNSSLTPYVLKVTEANQKDEDSGSVVKNNIPSKPLSLKRPAPNRYYATGYMNMTSNKGDVDYYKFVASKNTKLTLTLELPSDLDGKVTVYNASGKAVASADHYGKGDDEVLPLNLKKGTYYIKVEDVMGSASTEPYRLVLK